MQSHREFRVAIRKIGNKTLTQRLFDHRKRMDRIKLKQMVKRHAHIQTVFELIHELFGVAGDALSISAEIKHLRAFQLFHQEFLYL